MNTTLKKHLLFLFIIICSTVYGQNSEISKKDPIDIALEQCLDSSENYSTYGIMNCISQARDSWDIELNKYYELLMNELSSDEKQKLRQSEKNWLAYRDSELIFASTMYDNMEGTMWRSAIVHTDLNLIKHRVLELKAYYGDKTAGQ